MARRSGESRALVPAAAPSSPSSPSTWGVGQPFSPGQPFTPVPIDPRTPTGALEPRRAEYATSINLQMSGARLIPFGLLREASGIDIIRRCIEVRKSELMAYDWDITPTRRATIAYMRKAGVSSPGKAAQLLRDELEPEIIRLRTQFEHPDPVNDQDYSTWIGLVMEEMLTTDATSIYPRRKLSGDVLSFEVLDGSTIKPLLDHRGSRPMAPAPAFQQILYGFPRGEWESSTIDDGAEQFRSDQLIYRPFTPRTWTPFGYPPVEQALAAADVYLKRMNWIRGEFSDGSTPDTFMETTSTITPADLLQWAESLNGLLVGQPNERRKIIPLPKGMTPHAMSQFAERYSTDLDELFIKLLCACFAVLPTQIGFTPKSGIGGKGHQEGEGNSSQRLAVRPTASWVESLNTDLMVRYLYAPQELQFKVLGYEIENENDIESILASQVDGGRKTRNEGRAEVGLPMLDYPEADELTVMTGSGLVFLKGAMQAAKDAAEAANAPPPPPAEPAAAEAATAEPAAPASAKDPAVDAEVQKFERFARNRAGRAWRDFEFEVLGKGAAADMNKLASAGDLDGALKVARVSRLEPVSEDDKAELAETHGAALAAAAKAALPKAEALTSGWAPPETDAREAAVAYVDGKLTKSKLTAPVAALLTAGHAVGYGAAGLPPSDAAGPRLTALLDGTAAVSDRLAALVAAGVGGALVARTDDTEAAVDDFLDGGFAEGFASLEVTASLTAGTLDGCEKSEIANVRLVASDGECEFCEGFDGRIMRTNGDDDNGMPPLHTGCNCGLEPLD